MITEPLHSAPLREATPVRIETHTCPYCGTTAPMVVDRFADGRLYAWCPEAIPPHYAAMEPVWVRDEHNVARIIGRRCKVCGSADGASRHPSTPGCGLAIDLADLRRTRT